MGTVCRSEWGVRRASKLSACLGCLVCYARTADAMRSGAAANLGYLPYVHFVHIEADEKATALCFRIFTPSRLLRATRTYRFPTADSPQNTAGIRPAKGSAALC
eukprot:6208419-Pleurochrysis_carterae.AAC.3